MSLNKNPFLTIEKKAFADFMRRWTEGRYRGQRLGQAFYNEYNLHRLSDQASLKGLYEADGEKAKALIDQIFTFS